MSSSLTLITTNKPHGKPMGRDSHSSKFLNLFYTEWGELFFVELKCPGYVWDYENENREEGVLKRKEIMRKALPDYPLLARIDDIYQDVFYSADELPYLFKECEDSIEMTDNETALSGLKKLITKCHEGIEFKLGLSLVAD